MKNQINQTNEKEKVKNITRFILELLGAATILSVALVAPNAMVILDKFGRPKRKFTNDRLKRNFYYLKTQGYAYIRKEDDKTILEITKKGKKKILSYKIEELKIKKPEKWDEKWRIVTADVPESKRLARDTLRSALKRIGFYRWQKSVWIHPYDCEDEIESLKEIYELRPYLHFIVAEKIDEEHQLKKFFQL